MPTAKCHRCARSLKNGECANPNCLENPDLSFNRRVKLEHEAESRQKTRERLETSFRRSEKGPKQPTLALAATPNEPPFVEPRLLDPHPERRPPKPAVLTRVREAGEDHAVLTVVGGKGGYKKFPCAECPWRKSNCGNFPDQAFEHSALTAYDMAHHTFACHMQDRTDPQTCAGFLLSESARDNLSVRVRAMKGAFRDVIPDPYDALYKTYREMAIANGVPADSDLLEPCMPEARNRWLEEHADADSA